MLQTQCVRRQLWGGGCHRLKCKAAVEVAAAKPVVMPCVVVKADPQPVKSSRPRKPCSVPGCEHPVNSKGLCYGHYWQKKGAERRVKRRAATAAGKVSKPAKVEKVAKPLKKKPEPVKCKAGAVVFQDRNWAAYHRLLELSTAAGVDPDDLLADLIHKESGDGKRIESSQGVTAG